MVTRSLEQDNDEDREELVKCLDLLQPDDLLILKDRIRLGRTMLTILVEVNHLFERGVYIKTLDGRLDTSLMNDEIVRLIVGEMAYRAEWNQGISSTEHQKEEQSQKVEG